MTKKEAVALFGTTQTQLANALGKGKSAISQWPETLTSEQTNLVLGAALRKGIKIPKDIIEFS